MILIGELQRSSDNKSVDIKNLNKLGTLLLLEEKPELFEQAPELFVGLFPEKFGTYISPDNIYGRVEWAGADEFEKKIIKTSSYVSKRIS